MFSTVHGILGKTKYADELVAKHKRRNEEWVEFCIVLELDLAILN
jgi:hypothetical protein